jgi:magnesium transporter
MIEMSIDLRLAESFAAGHGASAAKTLASIDSVAAAAFLGSVADETAATLLAHMSPHDAARCILKIDTAKAADIFQSLGLHGSILVLRTLDRTARDSIISVLPPAFASRIERHLRYSEGSAGWLADSSVIALPESLRVAEAREESFDTRIPYVYLVDPEQRLVGVVMIRDIMTRPGHEALNTLATLTPVRVSARTGAAELTRHRAWTHLDALPVVDSRGVYLGALRHKMLRQLENSPPTTGDAGSPLLSVLELAELYWSGLSSAMLPFSGGTISPVDQESPHEP